MTDFEKTGKNNKKTITIIAAASTNNALGKNNDLLWHLPDDFKRFKKHTSGHHIIMGRKTFESLPGILPNRIHVVITRDVSYCPDNVIVVHSLEEALAITDKDSCPFIIGGGEIYKLAMHYADVIELTRIHHVFEADTFFPDIDTNLWKLAKEEFHDVDQHHDYSFSYQTYIRK